MCCFVRLKISFRENVLLLVASLAAQCVQGGATRWPCICPCPLSHLGGTVKCAVKQQVISWGPCQSYESVPHLFQEPFFHWKWDYWLDHCHFAKAGNSGCNTVQIQHVFLPGCSVIQGEKTLILFYFFSQQEVKYTLTVMYAYFSLMFCCCF